MTDHETAGRSKGRLQEAASGVADQAGRTVDAQASGAMTKASETLDHVARVVRDAGSELRGEQPQIATVADVAAQRVEDLSAYLREHDSREVIGAVEDVARRQPALVVAGGLALGVMLGRLIRSADGRGDAFRPYGDGRWHGYERDAGSRIRTYDAVGYGAGSVAGYDTAGTTEPRTAVAPGAPSRRGSATVGTVATGPEA